MGALHEGHLSLMRRSIKENDVSCASIFVNPLQFNDPDDYARYPRDEHRDHESLSAVGCSMVFSATLGEMFGDARLREVPTLDPGPGGQGLEGEFRPGHLEGVCTIVDRLFRIVGDCSAYFGAKDYQQLVVVRDVAARLGFPEVIACETVRDPDGLALSSRNRLLSAEERRSSLRIHQALMAAKAAWRSGVRDCKALQDVMKEQLQDPLIKVDYADLRAPGDWQARSPHGQLDQAVALIAAHVGKVRLIDNMRLD